jgi:Mg-chelatase subunit ChlD
MTVRRALRDLAPLALVALLAALALGGLRWRRSEPGMLAVLLDVSGSVAPRAREQAARRIEEALADLPHGTPVAVYAFDSEPRLLGVGTTGKARTWLRSAAALSANGSATDMGRALDDAAMLVHLSGGGAILVVSDGNDLAGGGLAAARAAFQRGVSVQGWPLAPRSGQELAVEGVTVPARLRPGELFEATAFVRSTVAQRVKLTLEQDGAGPNSVDAEVEAGARHAFRILQRAGAQSGNLVVVAAGEKDTDPGNNLASAHLSVSGGGRFAVVGFSGPLPRGTERWDRLPGVPSVLERYDAVHLGLGRSAPLSRRDQTRLAGYVLKGGRLLISCADPEGAAVLRGGPLEEILPVRLEPPRKQGDDASVVLLLDRSGSMHGKQAGATGLSIALQSARDLGSLLSGNDRYGVIAFDVSPHVLRPMAGVAQGAVLSAAANAVEASGGTDWGSSLDLALDWLDRDAGSRRHIVLVSDGRLAPGASGESSRPWPEGVTLSTVSTGENPDAALLAGLAARHGGRYDHASRLEDLPDALVREETRLRLPPVRTGPLLAVPRPAFARILAPVALRRGDHAMVLTAKEGVEILLETDAHDPLLTSARSGWGRCTFLAADPGSLLEPRDRSDAGASLLVAALKWDSGDGHSANPPPNVRLDGARAIVEALVPESARDLPRALVLAPSGHEMNLAMLPVAPSRVRGSFLVSAAGEYLIEVGGSRVSFQLASLPERSVLPHDPEWADHLAAMSGRRVLSPPTGGVETGRGGVIPLPPSRSVEIEAAPWLLALAGSVFLINCGSRLRMRPAPR